ncbi:ATP-binding protein [Olsenella uli]|uniref:ATP-binding protein n=1 Tax=Olsenella uli TaxID=133926 RepID=UPI00044623CF|nr:ATP-binding protein [Olsenella uli]EUB32610.1 IstB-like ATP-binding protein [Olsenella uli MSTE5]
MLTLADLFRAHGGELPEGGFTAEEVWATNRMTPDEWSLAMDAEREARRAFLAAGRESDEDRRYRELRAATVAAGVPERYASGAIDSRYVRAMASGRGLWLYGDVGTGKTTAACAALRGWVASGRRAAFVSAPAMLADLRDAMFRHDEAHATARYATAALLVLDDLDKEPPTARALAKLFEVIDARYSRGLPTVVTSQLGPSEIGARLGSQGDAETATAIVSRLVGTCRVMRMLGADRRVHG